MRAWDPRWPTRTLTWPVVTSIVVAFTLPMAKQSLVVGHEMPDGAFVPEGRVWLFQVPPPSTVASTTAALNLAFCAVAQQSAEPAQAKPFTYPNPLGRLSVTHVLPPSVVDRTAAPVVPAPPATHSEVVRQATALR